MRGVPHSLLVTVECLSAKEQVPVEDPNKDYNDEIRQEQLRELSFLNGSEDSSRVPGLRGRGIRAVVALSSRGRGVAIAPHPTVRTALAPRGAPVPRGSLSALPIARGVTASRARGTAATTGYRPPPPLPLETYDEYECVGIQRADVRYQESFESPDTTVSIRWWRTVLNHDR
ncbi:hypothetical protein NDU88_003328 [Pleurodeles waltl]|uniref:Uncharacterized protein n=1 Tax=Pleurodeles waltl TaxID=8319 RepID=A0AAV7RCT7_PLEWA|nr:hypothetical protein NDU88_003328 [Pleurodeles waltl]